MAETQQPSNMEVQTAPAPSNASDTNVPRKSTSEQMPSRPPLISGLSATRRTPSVWRQCIIIVEHVWWIRLADIKATLFEIALPILFIFALWGSTAYLQSRAKDTIVKQEAEFAKLNTPLQFFEPVPVRAADGSSYLTAGQFMPFSQLAVAPKSAATMTIAKNAFTCMLRLAGYKPDAKTLRWSNADLLTTTTTTAAPAGTWVNDDQDKTPIAPTSDIYNVDELVSGFNDAAEAVKYIAKFNTYPDTFGTAAVRAPVALVFDDDAVNEPSYSLFYTSNVKYHKQNGHLRLPSTGSSGMCRSSDWISSDLLQQECTSSYSDCINSPCQVRYSTTKFDRDRQKAGELCKTDKYIFAGVVPLQYCIDVELTRKHAQLTTFEPIVSTQMLPKLPRVKPRPPGDTDPGSFLLMFGVGGAFTTICVVSFMMTDKEKKLKQGLHMMGVSPTAYWMGWYLASLAIWCVVVAIMLIMLLLPKFSPLLHVNVLILFLVLMMAGISTIFMAFVFVALFNRGVMAVLATTMFLFLSALSYIGIVTYNQTTGCVSAGTYWGLSLLSNFAFMIAVERMEHFVEHDGQTVWADFGRRIRGISIGEAFMMQIIDTIIYAFLAYYLDQVLPNDYGTCKHPLFFVHPEFWRALLQGPKTQRRRSLRASEEVMAELNANQDVEPVNIQSVDSVGVVTNKLCKAYGSKKVLATGTKQAPLVVNNLSMAIFKIISDAEETEEPKSHATNYNKNEITALLGHNGAGKTTTFRILTGQTAPTSGAAYILDYDIRSNEGLRAVQATLGLCPQDNVLWPNLSVAQHLRFFGKLKGLTRREAEDNGKALLTQLELSEKWSARSGKLSGGQKRRLCLAFALVGNPEIVFLDEPSSGVDPQSRRKMWDTLNAYKAKERCIVLTTHSMYEADVLADRKIIISKGRLQCAGSSVFLKNRYGAGYKLNIELDGTKSAGEREASMKTLTEKISAVVPSAVFPVVYSASNFEQLSVQLPKADRSRFADLFSLLDSKDVDNLGIMDIGMSVVSLDEIFIKLNEHKQVSDNNTSQQPTSLPPPDKNLKISSKFFVKFLSILRLRLVIQFRRPVRYVCTLLLAILLLFLTAYTPVIVPPEDAPVIEDLSPIDLHSWRTKLLTSDKSHAFPVLISVQNDDEHKKISHSLEQLNLQHERLSVNEEYENIFSRITQTDNKNLYQIGAKIHAWSDPGAPRYTVWYNGTFMHSLPIAFNLLNSLLYNHMTGRTSGIRTKIFQTTVGEIYGDGTAAAAPPPVEHSSVYTCDIMCMVFYVVLYTTALSFLTAFLVVDPAYDNQTGAIRLLRLSGACTLPMYWLPMFLVHLLTFILPAMIMFIIFSAIWPADFMTANEEEGRGVFLFMFCMHTILFILVMTLAAYCFSKLFRKANAALICTLIVTICCALILSFAGLVFFGQTIGDSFGSYVQFTVIAGTDTSEDSLSMVPLHQLLSLLLPHYGFATGLFMFFSVSKRGDHINDWRMYWTSPYYGPCFAGFLLWLAGTICILIFSELKWQGVHDALMHRFLSKRRKQFDQQTQEQLELDNNETVFVDDAGYGEDDDVRNERILANKAVAALVMNAPNSQTAVEMGVVSTTPAVTALHLNKQYFLNTITAPQTVIEIYAASRAAAVRNVSFRVLPNEVFGLLGPNGAGKTTAILMIVHDVKPTAGIMYINRFNTALQWKHAHRLLGYCPQFDLLWDEITVSEHLKLFAELYELPQSDLNAPSGRLWLMVEKLGLSEHWHKQAGALSGGTRRKLSFLISIIDRNMTSLLDEPSSGMDPSSARYLWDLIKQHVQQQQPQNQTGQESQNLLSSHGCVLTTHYMEEAEALCDRIAIMTRGSIRCIGTSTHLRNKFGSGYRLEFRLVNDQEDTRTFVAAAMMAQFSEAIFNKNESRLNRLVFSVPQHQALPLSKTFAFLESQRIDEELEVEIETKENQQLLATSDKKVVEYTISQASIEHVFLRFAENAAEAAV